MVFTAVCRAHGSVKTGSLPAFSRTPRKKQFPFVGGREEPLSKWEQERGWALSPGVPQKPQEVGRGRSNFPRGSAQPWCSGLCPGREEQGAKPGTVGPLPGMMSSQVHTAEQGCICTDRQSVRGQPASSRYPVSSVGSPWARRPQAHPAEGASVLTYSRGRTQFCKHLPLGFEGPS